MTEEMDDPQPGRRQTTSKWFAIAIALVVGSLGLVTVAYSEVSSPVGCGEMSATSETDPSVSGLWVMDADGSHERRLTEGRGWGSVAWSPDSKRVASWNQPASGGPNRLFVTNVDGTEQDTLTDGTAAQDIAWSPNGSKIFFNVMRNENNQQVWDRYAINPDGSGQTLVLEGVDLGEPAVSPDGTKIVFTGSDQQIYVMNADGSGRVRLTEGANPAFSPVWSPDGTKILFSADAAPGDPISSTQIEILDIGDTQRDVVAAETDMFLSDPVWSPDGEWIVFDSYPHDDWGWVTVVRPDGTERHNVTAKLREPVMHDAAWSPDGRIIAFTDGDGIGIANPGGSERACLTSKGSHSPVWSPDGTKIAFFRS